MAKHEGLQKIKIAKLVLLEDILWRRVGENIDTVTNYSKLHNLSLGTIQKALSNLIDDEIIILEKKGKMGSVIKKIDYKKLLIELDKRFLLGVMPITYSQRYKGLLKNIEEKMKLEIPIYFAHMRGGNIRLKLIEDGIYDFGVVSKLTAMKAIENGMNIESIKNFGKESYVTKHVILKRETKSKKIKVGIDRESEDHVFLTNTNFKKDSDIEFIDIRYSEVIEKLIDGTVDAAIWNYDDVLDKEIILKKHNIKCSDLESIKENIYATEAVIVVNKTNKIIKNIFTQFFK